MRIGIEIAAKRNVDVEGELREVIAILSTARGTSANATLIARYRLSRILFQRGHAAEARAEIVDTIAHFDPATDPVHAPLRSAKALLDMIEGRPNTEKLIV